MTALRDMTLSKLVISRCVAIGRGVSIICVQVLDTVYSNQVDATTTRDEETTMDICVICNGTKWVGNERCTGDLEQPGCGGTGMESWRQKRLATMVVARPEEIAKIDAHAAAHFAKATVSAALRTGSLR